MAIQYVGCTEDRGVSTTSEISAGVSGTLKFVTDAAVNVATKSSKVENTPVALQIVHDCMQIAKSNSPPDDPEQVVAANYIKQWQKQVIDQTPTLTISPATAKVGDKVTVKGSKFWATEMVAIRLGATLLDQVKADENGRFTVVITVPPDAPPPDFGTHIVGTGESSASSADAPFRTKQ